MTLRPLACACLLSVCTAFALPALAVKPADSATLPAPDAALAAAIGGDWRTPDFVKRDAARHPGQTLAFFGIAPTQTVVEITPGGGWYTEILAPYLKDSGKYVAAVVDPATVEEGRGRDYQARAKAGLESKIADAPAYAKVQIAGFDPKAPSFGPDGSADLVLTFRNVHNWRMSGQAEAMFKGFHAVLRSGGTLGVVEHRANADVPGGDRSGYMSEAQVIALAEGAGFKLEAKSEINANPRDTKDHPNGVWTLPPSNNHDEADREKYAAIGESDRMTLKFVKP
ncbi:class I SAM-dependent methyltransferase [Chiayiivirga flava]|uniref:Putative methyltransferase n=1 Tax=Chiayiivirga flava TaxID=659595 RepID=A0A7W8D4I5_9GAMM|nr:class I SAM-dependent methyltransferase [Chiayiivirga flava]MBB5207793.1 putative methyltransferase [Chiayiivirga flava]